MTPQEIFDKTYITSTEICQELSITRATVVQGRKRGLLPDPVVINGAQIHIWPRDVVRPHLDAWKISLRARRGELRT